MNDQQYDDLLNLIIQKTRAGNIQWSPSSISDTYQANIGIGSVAIFYDSDPDTAMQLSEAFPIASLNFRNERGETFKRIQSYYTSDPDHYRLYELYQLAHNAYMKTNETVQSMFDELSRQPS